MSRRLVDGIAVSHEKLTVDDSVTVLTASKYFPDDGRGSCQRAFITIEGSSMRYLTTGNDPTSTEGHLMQNGSSMFVTGDQNIKSFKIISIGSRTGFIQVTYERVC